MVHTHTVDTNEPYPFDDQRTFFLSLTVFVTIEQNKRYAYISELIYSTISNRFQIHPEITVFSPTIRQSFLPPEFLGLQVQIFY
jgi:hypothetical protein